MSSVCMPDRNHGNPPPGWPLVRVGA
jgi:hypothetical protein